MNLRPIGCRIRRAFQYLYEAMCVTQQPNSPVLLIEFGFRPFLRTHAIQ